MSKHNNKGTSKRISIFSELPPCIIDRNPIIQIFSDREIIFEGVAEIEQYSQTTVVVSNSNMRITLNGKNLVIKCLTNNNLAVCGKIDDISFIKEKKV